MTEEEDFSAKLRRAEAAQLKSKEAAVAGGGPGSAVVVGVGAQVVLSPASGTRRVSVVRFLDEQPHDPSQLAGGGAGGARDGLATDENDLPLVATGRMGSEKSHGSEKSLDTMDSNDTTSSAPKQRKLKRKQSLSDLINRRAPVLEVVLVHTHPINTKKKLLTQCANPTYEIKILIPIHSLTYHVITFVGRGRRKSGGGR